MRAAIFRIFSAFGQSDDQWVTYHEQLYLAKEQILPVCSIRTQSNGSEASITVEDAKAGNTLELPLAFEADSFVTAEAYGEAGEVYCQLMPGFKPFAFTNPIFVDADGDGTWKIDDGY